MNFGEVLSKAWQIVWKFKVLWIFGILAGCASGYGGSGNVSYNFQSSDLPYQVQNFIDQTDPSMLAALGVLGVLILVILIAAMIFLGTIGRVGLIRGAQQADQGVERLPFGELFRGSMAYFWRVFFLYLLIAIAGIALVVLLFILGVMTAALTFGIALICLIPLACLVVPIAWLISIVLEQATIAIVTEDVGISDGLGRGWRVFKENFGAMIAMGLILLVLSLFGSFVIYLPIIALAFPVTAGLIWGSNQPGIPTEALIAGACAVAYLPLLLIFNGILRGYVESAWTLTFLRLTGAPRAAPPALPVEAPPEPASLQETDKPFSNPV